ncbi:hypothetical protein Tco_1388325 [Tanacetum coccineum]
MSKSANHVSPTPDGSVIRNIKGTRSKQTLDGRPRFKPEEVIQFCDKHYNQLLPLMAENVHHEKLKGEISKKIRKPNPNTKSRTSLPFQSPSVFFRLRHRDSKPSHHESLMGTNGSKYRTRRDQKSDPKMRRYDSTPQASRDPENEGNRLGTSSKVTLPALVKGKGRLKKNRM